MSAFTELTWIDVSCRCIEQHICGAWRIIIKTSIQNFENVCAHATGLLTNCDDVRSVPMLTKLESVLTWVCAPTLNSYLCFKRFKNLTSRP